MSADCEDVLHENEEFEDAMDLENALPLVPSPDEAYDLSENSEDELGDMHDLEVDSKLYNTPGGRRSCVSVDSVCDPPYVGMSFETFEDLDMLLKKYARQKGFGVVKGGWACRQVNGQLTKEKRSCTWKCDKFGKPDVRRRSSCNGLDAVSEKGVHFASGKSKKCGCLVSINGGLTKEGRWQIKKLCLDHNHEVTPSKSNFISMFRQEDLQNVAVRRRLFQHRDAGVSIPQIHDALAGERNGVENLALTDRDIRNVLDRDRRAKYVAGDANAMMAYLDRMSRDNSNFFHLHRLDEEGRLKDVMWVDARSRAAYEDFGDVVCLDSTYLTNKYALPFTNFVGVNHHGQSLLLGCGLIAHEDTNTFEWLFANWLRCMGGKAPVGILTDQDPAMIKAVAKVMPKTRHRWCLWHILNKFPTKLGIYKSYEGIKVALSRAIYDSYSVTEFESKWNAAIKRYKLEGNEWLQGLYAKRDMWIPPFVRDMFWAGMRSTQRSESIHSFFDKYLTKNTRLFEFVPLYCKALERRMKGEKQADVDSCRSIHDLVTVFACEKFFQKIYTPTKFRELQMECLKGLYVHYIKEDKIDGDLVDYIVEDRIWVRNPETRKDIPTYRRRMFKVTYDKKSNEAWCICKMFDSCGLLCRHIIRLLDRNNVKVVPDMFVMQRWRKDVKRKHTTVKVAYHDPSKNESMKRFDKLMVVVEPICVTASANAEETQIVIQAMHDLNACLRQRREKVGLQSNNHLLSNESQPYNQTDVCHQQQCGGESHPYNESPDASINPQPPATPQPPLHRQPPQHAQPSEDVEGHETMPPQCDQVTGNFCPQPSMNEQYNKGIVTVNDPLIKAKKHRTTDRRYPSLIEKVGKMTKKGRSKSKGKVNYNDQTCFITPPTPGLQGGQQQQPFPYSTPYPFAANMLHFHGGTAAQQLYFTPPVMPPFSPVRADVPPYRPVLTWLAPPTPNPSYK